MQRMYPLKNKKKHSKRHNKSESDSKSDFSDARSSGHNHENFKPHAIKHVKHLKRVSRHHLKNRAPSCPPIPRPNLPTLDPIQVIKAKKAKPIKKVKSCSCKLNPKRAKKVLPIPSPIIERRSLKKAVCDNDKYKKKVKKEKECKVVIAAN